jgi:hypothetical protein
LRYQHSKNEENPTPIQKEMTMTENLAKLKEKTLLSIGKHISIWEGRIKKHKYWHNSLVVISIALSASITIVGIFNQGLTAAVLAAILSGILTFQQTFPFGEMSYFYRVGVAEAEILKLDLDTKADTLKEVESIEIKFETLIRMMAQDIPRGEALHNAIQNMRKEVKGS